MLIAPMVFALALSFSRSPDCFKMDHGGSRRKHAPVHRVGKSLILREAEAWSRRGQRRKLLDRLRGLLAMAQTTQGQARKKLF